MHKKVKLRLKKLLPKLRKIHIEKKAKSVIALPEDTVLNSPTEIEGEERQRISLPKDIGGIISEKRDVLKEKRRIQEHYPLYAIKQGSQSVNLAYASIRFDPRINTLYYNLIEPQVNEQLINIIERVSTELHDRLEVDFTHLKSEKALFEYIDKEINNIFKLLGIKLSAQDSLVVKYYVFRDAVGLGKIEALMRDPYIEDINCDGVGLPIYVFHRNPLYAELPTNITFWDKDELDAFVMKLAQKCNRTVSIANPLMDGSLPDGSRVQITLGTDIARRGSNFTIRKFFKVPLTPIGLINYGTIEPLMLAYLWLAIENESSILISGTTATGKTTMLNALSLFIEPNLKIVSIEDTNELQLPHVNWMPQVARAGFGATGYGEVSMYDLLRAALRQRPDYLIVGEVRGKEANVLFHAMASGHPGLSTIHADSVRAVIDRLTTRPIDLPMSLLDNLDVLIFLEKVKLGAQFTRRVSKIIEIEGYNQKEDSLKTNVVFEWVPSEDKFVSHKSSLLYEIAKHTGLSEHEVQEELLRRVKVLEWMRKNNLYLFNDVSKILNMYYADPNQLFKHMG